MEGGRGARLTPATGCSWAAFEKTAKDYGTNERGLGKLCFRLEPRARISPRGKLGVGGVHKCCSCSLTCIGNVHTQEFG